jgi:hypothetical protein
MTSPSGAGRCSAFLVWRCERMAEACALLQQDLFVLSDFVANVLVLCFCRAELSEICI